MSAWAIIVSLAALLSLAAGPVLAQQRPSQPPAAPAQPPAPPPEPPPPPYEPHLLRLSELLGALAYLRPLCGHEDGAVWRTRMAALIDVEGTSQHRRETMAGAFNRGFSAYSRSYRTCTASARLIIDRFVQEGAALTRDVSTRFRG
jgi:uncharacterized protein (TIGR02301 family)